MSKKTSVTTILASVILSFVFLQLFFGKTEKTKFEELALGVETSSFFPRISSHPIHIAGLDSLDSFIEGWKSRGQKDLILWLGNSQLHGINQFKEGDNTSPGYFYNYLKNTDFDLLAFSLPNANLQEHYLLFEYLKSILPVKELILGICFDDLREASIRHDLAGIFSDAGTIKALGNTQTGLKILNNNSQHLSEPDDLAALNETVQEYTEIRLNNWLNNNVELWNSRPQIRGHLFNQLYLLRNNVFNINPSSVRKMIKSRYHDNMLALSAIYSAANASNIKTYSYILPIRNDVALPYDINEYENFKISLDSLNTSTDNVLFNFESIVPAKFWGTKDATTFGGEKELDFMHFQSAGHKILADSLWRNIRLLNDWSQR
ncbi:MAG: hypothetical protein IPM14_14910 [bacterium]|nr:hypothetical protein [bacterium]